MKYIIKKLEKLNKWILSIINGKNILKYSKYKRDQALWIQREDYKRTNQGTNTEQFCIECYCDYLNLCGFKSEIVNSKISEYFNNIGTYHILTGDEMYNRGYDKNVVDNINHLMDKLIK